MGLKKGMTNNPNGRKKGVPNKSTHAIKEALAPIVSGQLDNLKPEDWVALKKKSFKDYIDALSKLLPYVAAKQTEGKIEISDKTIRIVDDTE